MSTITNASFWNDPGFVEEAIEVPRSGSALPSPDHAEYGLNPTKSRMFSELRVPVDYLDALNWTYLRIAVHFNDGNDQFFYGWIDSVELVSDTEDAPVTNVHWHVDLWRTYFGNAEFGSGLVLRRPVRTNDTLPPQPYPYRFMRTAYTKPLILGGTYWVIVNLVKNVQSSSSTYSEYETRCFPIVKNPNTSLYVASPGGMDTQRVPTISDVVRGRWDEYWNIDPESVSGVFISPVPPSPIHGTGSQTDPFYMYGYFSRDGMTTNGYLYYSPGPSTGTQDGPSVPVEGDLGMTFVTDDTHKYVFTGFDGEVIGELPWGIPVRYYTYRLVIGATYCYMSFRFNDTSATGSTSTKYMDSRANGINFTLPCPAMDVTSNARSSYVYSGQRAADMQARNLEIERIGMEGQMDVLNNTIFGTLAGAQATSSVLPTGLAGAALGGALAGLATEGVLAVQVAWQTYGYQPGLQAIEDYKASHQTNGILVPGTDWDGIYNGRVPAIVEMDTDSYSQTQRTNDMTIYGAHVSEPLTDCTSLIQSNGPLQIENLIVKGDIPLNAKTYIATRFSRGVILK